MAKKATPATVGTRFRVSEPAVFKVGNKIIGKYDPAHEYTVSDTNCDFVGGLIADEKATTTGVAKAKKAGGKAKTG